MARAAPESRQQARTIAYSLARALRALAGGLSWERLGRIALLENASEILSKSLPEASRDLPELTLALLGLILTLLGVIWGLLGLMLGLLGLILGLLGRSWALLGRSWGASGEPLGPSKTLQNRSRRLSRRPPAPELDFGSILAPFWGSFWLHFGTPRTSKNVVFVWRVCHFSKKRGVRKNTLKTETWLSWNGKRARRESVQALQARREQREQQEEPEPERQNHQEEQGESGEGRPRIETASAYYRL